jgi:hypothetical protein
MTVEGRARGGGSAEEGAPRVARAAAVPPYGNEAALVVARQLDAKVESLLEAAAR